jgi:peroxiredoxin
VAAALADPATAPPRRRNLVGPFSRRQVLLALASVLVAAVVLGVATRPLGEAGPGILPDPRATAYLVGSPTVGLQPGSLAPELSVVRPDDTRFELADLDGHPIRLADLEGSLVWLNFWASWCPPCQAETPVLRELATTYRDRGLVLIGIQVQETVEDGRRYAERYSLPYRIGADVSADVFHRYRVYALPTQFLIDPQGVIRHIVNGPLTQGAADALLGPLLPPVGSPSGPPETVSPTRPGDRG